MKTEMARSRMVRFSLAERVSHWLVAISFVYAGLSGTALWSKAMWWTASVLGGGDMIRAWHPIAGIVFSLLLARLFWMWNRAMRLDAEDRQWLKVGHKYAMHMVEGVPESGRFNAGQKSLFWLQSTSATLLFASGIVLWFPELMPRTLRLIAVLVHPIAALASLGGIIVHIYMSTLVVPGAFTAMTRGWVSPEWAKSHHPKWYRETSK